MIKDLEIPISKKTKDKIIASVKSYIELFPEEYIAVTDQINKKRWSLDDMEFGQAITDSVIIRGLFEIPEKLETIIFKYLTSEELTEFRGLKGGRWFAQKFIQFRTANEV